MDMGNLEDVICILDISLEDDDIILMEARTLQFYKDGRMKESATNLVEFELNKRNLYSKYLLYAKAFKNDYMEIDGDIYISKYLIQIQNILKHNHNECYGDPYLDNIMNEEFNNSPKFLLKLKYKTNDMNEIREIRKVLNDFLSDTNNFYNEEGELDKQIRTALLSLKVEKVESGANNKIKKKI